MIQFPTKIVKSKVWEIFGFYKVKDRAETIRPPPPPLTHDGVTFVYMKEIRTEISQDALFCFSQDFEEKDRKIVTVSIMRDSLIPAFESQSRKCETVSCFRDCSQPVHLFFQCTGKSCTHDHITQIIIISIYMVNANCVYSMCTLYTHLNANLWPLSLKYSAFRTRARYTAVQSRTHPVGDPSGWGWRLPTTDGGKGHIYSCQLQFMMQKTREQSRN